MLASSGNEEVEFEVKNLVIESSIRLKPEIRINILESIASQIDQIANETSGIFEITLPREPRLVKNLHQKSLMG